MVLGQVRPLLEADEPVVVWAHVHALDSEKPGLVSMTEQRCLVHWSPSDEATASFRWAELTAWGLSTSASQGALLTMSAGTQRLQMVLPLTTDTRASNATRVMDHVARHAPPGAVARASDAAHPLAAERRGLRGHARRVVVTFVGLLVVLISAVFASPFVPGPGALTFLAGLAILAKEYDWARDVHHGVKRMFDRLWTWLRGRRTQLRTRRLARREARRGARIDDLARRRVVRDLRALEQGPAPDLEPVRRVQNE
jgi:hypothetical protein